MSQFSDDIAKFNGIYKLPVNAAPTLEVGVPVTDRLRDFKIIMQSNFSKLGADGQPIYDDRGKVLKGPNYWKPEPKIEDALRQRIITALNTEISKRPHAVIVDEYHKLSGCELPKGLAEIREHFHTK